MIYLVRHGESEWNVARLTQGQTMHPRLSERGLAQAHAAAKAIAADLSSRSLTLVVSSDLVRATQTAQIIGDICGCEIRADPRLREQALGIFEGMSYEQSFAAGSSLDWTDPDLPIGGGESVRQLTQRMTAALADLRGDDPVAVVSHGDAIRAALAGRVDLLPGSDFWVEVPNGSVAALDLQMNEPRWLPFSD